MINSVDLITVDESVIEYQPCLQKKKKSEEMGEVIPVVYIPRKPHPNGLLLYLSCSWLPHPIYVNSAIPVIIDLIPHLKPHDVSPSIAIEEIMKR